MEKPSELIEKLEDRELDEEQRAYWQQVLENCERGADYARRMLKIGKYAIIKTQGDK